MTAATPPATREIATLTDDQCDRLYLIWHDQVADEVGEAIAHATGYREQREHAYAALQRDITAIDLSRSAPTKANYPPESPGWKALHARGFLRDAERYYAGRNRAHALKLLQYAAEQAREVLRELGWQPAA